MDHTSKAVKLAADGMSAEQKANLHEVADLLTKIYETLVDMRYVDECALVRGPHELENELLAEYSNLGLDPAIIYLYSIMPYIDEIETEARNFFQQGAFFNQCKISDVVRGRDPRYLSPEGDFDDENGPYMRPWHTPLSNCGNRSPIIIYDAKQHRIWIIDQVEGTSTDPVYCKNWYGASENAEEEGSNWGGGNTSDGDSYSDGEEGAASDGESCSVGSSEFWDDEDGAIELQELEKLRADQTEIIEYDEGFEHVEELKEWEQREAAGIKNQNSLELVRSRSAGDVLRDIIQWYRGLRELPGQGEYSAWMSPEVLKTLYLNNGWPSHFNGDKFEIDMARACATDKARYDAEEPMRDVECYADWLKSSKRDIKCYTREVSKARSPDREWAARFKLWKEEECFERTTMDLHHAKEKAERLCPGGEFIKNQDLPLWQLERLRVELQWKREKAKSVESQTPEDLDSPEQKRHLIAQQRRAHRQLEVYEAAFQASKADAQLLCPGRTFQEATGIKSLGREDTLTSIETQKDVVKYLRGYLRNVEEFASTVPSNAAKATAAVEKAREDIEQQLDGAKTRLESLEKWLAEHGNTN